jgi:hypothetical protein
MENVMKVPHYGMFSDTGNYMIDCIVEYAKLNKLSWSEIYTLLERMSKEKEYAEATDTAVKEYVYEAVFV